MRKHRKYVPHCKWKNAVALTMAVITAGAWIPFAASSENRDSVEDDDETTTFPMILPPAVTQTPRWMLMGEPGPERVDLVKRRSPPAKPAVPNSHKPPRATHTLSPQPKPDRTPSILIAFLRAQIGDQYVLGGNGPDAWDCSGLTKAAYNKLGIGLPRTSQAQSLKGVRVSMSQLRTGDLLFWGVPGLAYHVAIYVGDGRYIAAQNPSAGVVERNLSYSPPDFARRIL